MKRPPYSQWRRALEKFDHNVIPHNRQAANWLVQVLDDPASSRMRRAAAYFASNFYRNPQLGSALARRALDAQEHPLVRGESLEAIKGFGCWYRPRNRLDRKVHSAVLGCLRDPHPNVRFWACYAAGHLHMQKAVRILRELTHDTAPGEMGWTVGYEATEALKAIQRLPAWHELQPSWNALDLDKTLD